ncbi:NAD-dependent epimerase/dehydratase family protein [Chryseobacterium oranimense]|uniref:NAD-dependent epimerase/dehydratase family protein n=1 Tax=Chryseobacterium oranimense TaxID=421058 RepID=UPI0021AFF969|nr:NAD-dependent epimerase/dehydratase family protein [Chryseobacterium oranimense]UWX60795.1 NAD-dependent epimerase/dehydratase family protein [Chryseobacterium oranimense]
MKVLFTGANGFLGRNVIPLLREKNLRVKTFGTSNADYVYNITNKIVPFDEKFDIIFHAAGKAHSIPGNKEEEQLFYAVNLEGTKNLCEALEKNLPDYFIFISTVAVYGKDFGKNINENSPLKGHTPYAKSKIMAEEFLTNWCKTNNVKLFILRPSLIAGPNPPGNLGDMISAVKKGRYFNIAGGKAQKSIFWVDDFAEITQKIINKKGGIYNVCDNHNPSFKEISYKISEILHKKSPGSIPYFIAGTLAKIGDLLGNKAPINSLRLKKITDSLTFSNEKIKKELDFNPSNVMEKFQL